MASYGGTSGLLQVLPSGALEGVTDDERSAAQDAACDTIDGYLRSRYTLPLASHGKDLERCMNTIAAYYLISARGWDPQGPDELLMEQHRQAIRWLQDISAGRVTLAVPVTSPDVELTPMVKGCDITRW